MGGTKQGISMLRSVFAFTTDNEVADRLDYGIYPEKKGIYNGDFKTYVVGHKHKERRVRLQ